MKNKKDIEQSVNYLFREYYNKEIEKFKPRQTYIFIINGMAESGKDTFIECCRRFTDIKNISSVDLIKEMAKVVDLHENREYLHKLKELTYKYTNYIDQQIALKIERNKLNFIHIREEKYFNKIPYKSFGKILIERPGLKNKFDFENGFNHDLYNHVIINHNIEFLPYKAKTFIEIYCDKET